MSEQPTTVYKVLSATELAQLEHAGRHDGTGDDVRDGFVHLSTAEQLVVTVAKHCADVSEPQLVAVDAAAQGERLKWEEARGGQLFPHLYGPLLLETVIAYGPLERDDAGVIRLPVAG